ncbi:hypothetical protein QMZ05_25570 [Bradyrhizobium sp. INPA03-11B]|uniref:hypothetical protein n=1 Tax=Bradyrhizobium sp. INPA03-11B TaxID=418598 RepID=UPI00338ECBEA
MSGVVVPVMLKVISIKSSQAIALTSDFRWCHDWYDTCCSAAKSVVDDGSVDLLFQMRFGGRPMTLPLLLCARAAIISWIALALAPFEIAFDAIEVRD